MALCTRTPSAARHDLAAAIISPDNDAQSRLMAPRASSPQLANSHVDLFDFIEREGGLVTLDEISRAFPDMERPVSTVLELCDSGILCADLAPAFDGGMLIWHIGD